MSRGLQHKQNPVGVSCSPSAPDDDEPPSAPHTLNMHQQDRHTSDVAMEAARADLIAAKRSGNVQELERAKIQFQYAHAALLRNV